MTSKSEIKYFASLKQKKYRKLENKFLAEGKRLVNEGINSNFECEKLFVTKHFYSCEDKFLNIVSKLNIEIDIIAEYDFAKLSSTKNPQGIVAVFKLKDNFNKIIENEPIVALENISDPGNMGTILRSCDWFGIKNVIISRESAEIYNPKVLRASMGAIFNLNIIENVDLIDEIKLLQSKNYFTFFADMKGVNYKNITWHKNTLITFCNEANGPTEELKKVCKTNITIPKKGKIESLNVAAAAAVIISEMQIS